MNDLLGEEGRKAADACVKVAIFGTPELRRYTRGSALERLWKCYGGKLPNKDCGKDLDPVILPERDDDDRLKKFYDINDIFNALDHFDKVKFVKIHTEDENENETVDQHRRDVLEECQNSPDATYSAEVAQRRVRDCYAGNFPGDVFTLPSKENDKPYSIFDIHDALVHGDKVGVLQYREEELTQAGSYTSALRQSIDEQRKTLSDEYEKAVKECQGETYSAKQAILRVKNCYKDCKKTKADKKVLKHVKLPTKRPRRYTIIDIRNTCLRCEDSFSVDTTRKISDARKEVDLEYQKTISSCERQGYSRDQAERLVRNCYVGSFPRDRAILPIKGKPCKTRYLISDIKEAVTYYDQKCLVETYPDDEEEEMQPDERMKKIKEIDEYRAVIEEEREEGKEEKEIDHGSGFIIQSHFIMTNAHVVSGSEQSVYIYNKIINPKLQCKVIHCEVTTCIDLAILYCEKLNINADGINIQPLQLSDETPLQGMSVYSFGYPFFHLGKRALLATGFVSGTEEPYGQGEKVAPLTLLNCPLNNGNSGGPLLRLVDKKGVKVVGLVKQKQIKDILEPEELKIIHKIETSLQTSSITDLKDRKLEGAEQVRKNDEKPDPCQTPLNLLTLKLHRAFNTHCQFVSSKAVPIETLRKFLGRAAGNYEGDNKEEFDSLLATSGLQQ